MTSAEGYLGPEGYWSADGEWVDAIDVRPVALPYQAPEVVRPAEPHGLYADAEPVPRVSPVDSEKLVAMLPQVQRVGKFAARWSLILCTPGIVVNGANTLLEYTPLGPDTPYTYSLNPITDVTHTVGATKHAYKAPIAIMKWGAGRF